MSRTTAFDGSAGQGPAHGSVKRSLRRTGTDSIVPWLVLSIGAFALAWGAIPSSVQAWQPPIGIPSPDFGITETAPPATKTLSGTLPTSLTLTPGSVVEIAPGSYIGSMTISGRCTAASPCFVRGQSETTKPQINGKFFVKNTSYVVLENLHFEGASCGALTISGASDNVSIRRSLLQNLPHPGSGGCSGIGIIPDLGARISDVVVYGNQFRNLGMNKGTWTTLDQDFHGVVPSLWGRDATTELQRVWILENECSELSGNCVQVNAGNWVDSYRYLHHVYVGRNVAHDNRQAGFWSKQARDVIMSQNVVFASRQYGSQPGDGIGFQYGPDNLWIIFNRIYDTVFGIRQSDTGAGSETHKAYVIGNVIHDSYQDPSATTHWNSPPGWGISLWSGVMSRYLIDNTIYQTHGGIEAILDGPLEMYGNVISDRRPPSLGFPDGTHVGIMHPARNGRAKIEHSLLHQPGSSVRVLWWDAGVLTGLGQFQTVTGQCATCLEADPAFADASLRNLRLSASSPARDKGIRHPAYDTFLGLYGLDIAAGADGAPRPASEAWDLGAYEYGSTSSGGGPPAPNNLQLH